MRQDYISWIQELSKSTNIVAWFWGNICGLDGLVLFFDMEYQAVLFETHTTGCFVALVVYIGIHKDRL